MTSLPPTPISSQASAPGAGRSLLRPFYPALDGLRAGAFLLVFTEHYGPTFWHLGFVRWGWTGVDMFFVLSGFLITGILADALGREDFFRSFYLRRTLRIFPLYYAVWLLVALLSPVLHVVWNRYVIAMAFYMGNWFMPAASLGLHADPASIPYASLRHHGEVRLILIRHFWSLCVEEQFYLVWPAVVWLVRSRRQLLRVSLAVAVLVPLLRTAYALHWPGMLPVGALYFFTWARLDTLMLGASIALWLRNETPPPRLLSRVAWTVTAIAPLLLWGALRLAPRAAGPVEFSPIVSTVGFSLVALTCGAVLLLALDESSLPFRLLKYSRLAALGRVSYGMYVIHDILLPPFTALAPRLEHLHLAWVLPPISLLVTFGLAKLSFRYLESPFLRLKSALAPRFAPASSARSL